MHLERWSTVESIRRKLSVLEANVEYGVEYGNIIWSMGVSHGVWEYHMEYGSIIWSMGVSFGVQEYHLEYRSMIQSVQILYQKY
jgi:hypothetical protein